MERISRSYRLACGSLEKIRLLGSATNGLIETMIRRVLTILSLLGLLLCVGLWGVSYWNVSAMFIRKAEGVDVTLGQGCLQFNYSAYVGGPRQPRNIFYVGGFRFETIWMPPYYFTSGSPRYPSLTVYVPVNLLALAFLILSGYLLAPMHRRRKRKKLGLCVSCGYDLRGSIDRCPECGMQFRK